MTIKLKVDFKDESKYLIMRQAAREAAKTLYATALMIKDRREPNVTLDDGDMLNRSTDLDIMAEFGQ